MTIKKLGDCKTLADFKEFSNALETDMKSGGRSFIYKGPKGNPRSYTMNQIVRQFEKCIECSRDETPNLCDEVNKGLKLIDQWNEEADNRENTCMLSIRKWLGNGWYSITHSGFNKNEALAKIRDANPPPPPQDAAPGFEQIDLEICVDRGEGAKNEPEWIFGKKQWQEFFEVDVGDVPPLPERIKNIMESDCPIWEGKKVSETHQLILMPKDLTLDKLGQIAKLLFPTSEKGYKYFWPRAQSLCELPIDQSYWVLITKDLIPKSYGKDYAKMQEILDDLSQSSLNDYQAPLALEAAVFALMEYKRDLSSKSWTTCQESFEDYQVCVQSLGEQTGLIIYNNSLTTYYFGVAGRLKF